MTRENRVCEREGLRGGRRVGVICDMEKEKSVKNKFPSRVFADFLADTPHLQTVDRSGQNWGNPESMLECNVSVLHSRGPSEEPK